MSMSMGPDSSNPFSAPNSSGPNTNVATESADLTVVDWLICILCSGIGCIVGIIRTIQGKPTGPKMIGISLLFIVIWTGIRLALASMAANMR